MSKPSEAILGDHCLHRALLLAVAWAKLASLSRAERSKSLRTSRGRQRRAGRGETSLPPNPAERKRDGPGATATAETTTPDRTRNDDMPGTETEDEAWLLDRRRRSATAPKRPSEGPSEDETSQQSHRRRRMHATLLGD